MYLYCLQVCTDYNKVAIEAAVMDDQLLSNEPSNNPDIKSDELRSKVARFTCKVCINAISCA